MKQAIFTSSTWSFRLTRKLVLITTEKLKLVIQFCTLHETESTLHDISSESFDEDHTKNAYVLVK